MSSPKSLEESRQSNYGPPYACHCNIAAAWSAYLQQREQAKKVPTVLRPEDVANMLALMKLIRAGYDPLHKDNYDDAEVYIGFARRFTDAARRTTGSASRAGSGYAPQDDEGNNTGRIRDVEGPHRLL